MANKKEKEKKNPMPSHFEAWSQHRPHTTIETLLKPATPPPPLVLLGLWLDRVTPLSRFPENLLVPVAPPLMWLSGGWRRLPLENSIFVYFL